MKLIEEMTTEEVVERLRNISRQRISEIYKKFAKRNDLETLRKIRYAKMLLKEQKKALRQEKRKLLLSNENSSQEIVLDKSQTELHNDPTETQEEKQ